MLTFWKHYEMEKKNFKGHTYRYTFKNNSWILLVIIHECKKKYQNMSCHLLALRLLLYRRFRRLCTSKQDWHFHDIPGYNSMVLSLISYPYVVFISYTFIANFFKVCIHFLNFDLTSLFIIAVCCIFCIFYFFLINISYLLLQFFLYWFLVFSFFINSS